MQVTSWSATQVGRARLVNQDTVLTHLSCTAGSPWALAAVADGMGGLISGEEASSLAVAALAQHLHSVWSGVPSEGDLEDAFLRAHQRVRAAAEARQIRMGTTLVAAVVGDGKAIVANVGDSRCYLVTDHAAQCLTIDHSLLQAEVADGRMTEDEASQSPLANVITRCVGASEAPPVVDIWRLSLTQSASLLLCSDGVHRVVDAETIRRTLLTLPSHEAADALIRKAVAQGAGDDLSIAILRYEPDPPTAG